MLVKPLWPIAEYMINYDYIVTNLCENKDRPQLQCDGKCYLSKLLAKENRQQEDNPFENQQHNIELVQFLEYCTQSNFILPPSEPTPNSNSWSYIDQKNIPPFINQPDPPPKRLV